MPEHHIRDRLQELDPNLDETSLYRTRDLVPAHMPDLRRGEVLITNWHNLERHELGDVNGQAARVVKRGVAVENTRVIRLTPDLTEEEVRRQATLGVFELVAADRKKYGMVRAFTVRDTKYYESDAFSSLRKLHVVTSRQMLWKGRCHTRPSSNASCQRTNSPIRNSCCCPPPHSTRRVRLNSRPISRAALFPFDTRDKPGRETKLLP